jgi:serine carboxypeptidase-like clade I
MRGKYRVLKFSGDTDGSVPTVGTRAWINSTGWEITEPYRSYKLDNQIAGYIEVREDWFTFGSVHGAGHMAPQYKPPQTYHLVFNWLYQRDI